jgi:hypothetical protein
VNLLTDSVGKSFALANGNLNLFLDLISISVQDVEFAARYVRKMISFFAFLFFTILITFPGWCCFGIQLGSRIAKGRYGLAIANHQVKKEKNLLMLRVFVLLTLMLLFQVR